MTAFLQYVVTGVSDGAAYALVGIGLVIVFRTTNALNFAQGVYAVVAGLTTSVLALHMPIVLAALIAIALTTSIGVVTGLITIGIRGDTTPLHSLIVTLGLTLIAESAELLIFGDAPHSYASIARRAWNVHGVRVQPQYVLLLGVTLAVTLGLTLLLRYTVVGNALVAASDSLRAARLVGIDTVTFGAVAFGVAALLGAIGGVLLTPLVPLAYDSDLNIAVNGFAAAAFGGLISVPGALVGGLVLGMAENLVVGYVNPQYELTIALVIMLVLIGWRARREGATA
ncbi:MAG TPA: branched-chain amino acid ABC transporter permease [Gaiellaceae bacterium]|nr:branched-chain amino acid ABC transporter permease [Gaiellaceae bacterium]